MDVSTVAFPIHITGLLVALWNIFHADHMGLRWVLGTTKKLDVAIVKKYHRGTWIGLLILITSGLTLFYPMREFLLSRPQFYAKMTCVLALVVNGIAITFLQKRAIENSFEELSFSQKLPLFISASVSTAGWIGAISMAFFLIPE